MAAPTCSGRRLGRCGLFLLGCLLLPSAASGQYKIMAPSGAELTFSEETLRQMLDTTRALGDQLRKDPHILYFRGTSSGVTADGPDGAFPWNAVKVLADSVATVQTPGNLREANRAFVNYAVVRMMNVRMDPDVSCDSVMSREVAAVSSFVEGWVVARTLFGGPAFSPLDEIAFAREAGVLPGMIAQRGDRQLGGCLAVWVRNHDKELVAYQSWRKDSFVTADSGTGDPPSPSGSV